MFGKPNLKILSLVTTTICAFTIFSEFIGMLHRPNSLSDAIITRGSKVPRSSIAKLSMLYGEPNPLYERALAAHTPHNRNFGYSMYVLREKTLPGYWSKPAYILDQLLAELALPEEQRLKWLVWVDGDIVLMNPKIPLEIFLPPEDKWGHIHALVTNDHRGLNNGVFFLRVHEWSVWLMTATLGLEIYEPDVELEFGDQSAMGIWVKHERFRDNIMHVPQRWFNAYAGNRGETNGLFADPLSPQTKVHANSIKEGDLLVHHAGHKSLRAQRMSPWMDVAEQHLPQWELDLDETGYEKEIREFWQNEAPKEKKRVDDMIKKEQNDKKKKMQMEEAEAAKKLEDSKKVAEDKPAQGREKQKDLEKRGS
ncbi:hypothetical protein LTR99_005022 [Exophiala xenobiotica]|nr:hypothetical protein H2202_005573 [Exophiala xenobiotica]KAK5196233.1 hypothetical protein LTR92_003777 [Exophiala xenobiotica]KAK5234394.1 hypothetical protein LTR47_004427 [Exophiala xenobiotica]KAK5254867.1 hypothetical protein LTS06_001006 [Exophiala xenobiotica]KAK5270580.1 hypothetical protein LTR96_003857 [Exophiala xenobiotica]